MERRRLLPGGAVAAAAVLLLGGGSRAAAQCVGTTPLPVSADTYAAAYDVLTTAVDASRSGRLVPDRLARGDLVGGVVRLAFHDAAGFDAGEPDEYGPDGCVDLSNPDNAGLAEIAGTLDQLQQADPRFCAGLSRADWWALAAKVAVERSNPDGVAAAATVPIRFGRSTNPSCSDFTAAGVTRLPGAEEGLSEIRRVFVDAMGLTMREAVALLGAHTLGRTDVANSGYTTRPWTTDPAVLDNDYFNVVVNEGWTREQVDGRVDKTTWVRGPILALNADMAIAYHAAEHFGGRCGPVGNTGRNACTENDDLVDSPHPHAVEFANDGAAWVAAFGPAMQRMSEVGYPAGALSCDPAFGDVADCVATTAPPTSTTAPTRAPTARPTTAAPTTAPTAAPAPAPTARPTTPAPTPLPTPLPSMSPTTSSPTERPTAAPTAGCGSLGRCTRWHGLRPVGFTVG